MQAFDCVLFDTEFTAWEGSKQRNWSLEWEHRELIQLAAVRICVSSKGVEVLSSFNELVKPQLNPNLSDYISHLTGIEQTVVDDMGVDFGSALTQFHQFCERGELCAYSWGNDSRILAENCALYHTAKPSFEAGFQNLQHIARNHQLPGSEAVSGDLAKANGITLEGHKHNALYDVRSLAVTMDLWIKSGLLQAQHLLVNESVDI